jgi:predicted amidohydrolase
MEALEEALRLAGAHEAELALAPEACLPGYAPGTKTLSPPGALLARVQALAEAHGIALACGAVDDGACALGLAVPGAGLVRYEKRFPTPAESRGWRPGRHPVVGQTPWGRVGLLLCADVLHADSWRPLRGKVDAVLVAGAWPDYVGRRDALGPLSGGLLAPVLAGSNAWREALLPQAARFVGAPVLWCNAMGRYPAGAPGENFSGGSAGWSAHGALLSARNLPLRAGRLVLLEAAFGGVPPGAGLEMPAPRRLFARGYRLAARLNGIRR